MWSSNHFSISSCFPCFSRSRFFRVQVFRFSRVFRVQVFRVRVQGPESGSRFQKQPPRNTFVYAYIRWVRKTNDSFFLGRLRQKDVKVMLKFIHDFSSFMKFDKSASIRSSHSQLLFKLGVLKNFANFEGKPLCRSLFLIKLQASGLFLQNTLVAASRID